jgi:hypothetical protein
MATWLYDFLESAKAELSGNGTLNDSQIIITLEDDPTKHAHRGRKLLLIVPGQVQFQSMGGGLRNEDFLFTVHICQRWDTAQLGDADAILTDQTQNMMVLREIVIDALVGATPGAGRLNTIGTGDETVNTSPIFAVSMAPPRKWPDNWYSIGQVFTAGLYRPYALHG